MVTQRARRMMTAAVAGLAAITMPVVSAGMAQAHGYPDNPPSRQALCADGTVSNCGGIKWEPQSVEGPGNFPRGGPADGHLCSGGNQRFASLADPRNGNWPATEVHRGKTVSYRWTITAAHSTTSIRYYITKNSWDPSQPLTRDALVLSPFHTVNYGGRMPESTFTHEVTLPQNKKGRHVIFTVWEIADTANAFYSCSDVVFVDGGDRSGTDGSSDTRTDHGHHQGGTNDDQSRPDSAEDTQANEQPHGSESSSSSRGTGGMWSWFSSIVDWFSSMVDWFSSFFL